MTQPKGRLSPSDTRRPLLLFLIATLIVAAELALYHFRWVVLAVFFAIGLSILFSPVMATLKRKLGVPRGVTAFLSFSISLALVAGISFLIYLLVADQILPVLKETPEFVQAVRSRISSTLRNYPGIQARINAIDLGDVLNLISQRVVHGLKLGAAGIAGFVFVLVVALYLAIEPESYVRGLVSLFPVSKRGEAVATIEAIAFSVRKWFTAQLIAMLAVGSATALGLLAVGIRDWLAFGLITGLLDVIPYFGPLTAAVAVALVTFATAPDKVPWVLLVFILMQQLESHLVIPWVMKGKVQLPPAHLIIFMLVLGSAFGVLGVLLAPGLLAVLRTLYLREYLPIIERPAPSDRDTSS